MPSGRGSKLIRMLSRKKNDWEEDDNEQQEKHVSFSQQIRDAFEWSRHHSIRGHMMKFVLHPQFDNFILLCIFVSSVLMIFDLPLNDPSDTLMQVIQVTDQVFGLIFTVEMTMKMIAFGVVFNNNPVNDQWVPPQNW